MRTHRFSIRAAVRRTAGHTAAAALAIAVAALPAAAQGSWGGAGWGRNGSGGYGSSSGGAWGAYDARPLFAWSGRVDREVLVVMRAGNVETQYVGRDASSDGRARVESALPRVPGNVDVRLVQGRGQVDVVEQPTRANGYTAVLRIRDDRGGADWYRVVATWRPTGGYADDARWGRDQNGSWGDRDDGGGWGRRRDGDDGRWGRNGSDDGRDDGGVYGGAGTGALHWSGRVDDVEEIRIQGRRVDTRTVSGAGASDVRSRLSGGLPARGVMVRVAERQGRGRVSVVQQPAAWNGYTAVIRVEDRQPGPGWYDLDVDW